MTGLVAAGVVTAPAAVVVIGGGLLAAGASYAVGEIYDNWDDITDSVGIVADTAQVTSGSAADSQSASLELARMSTQLQTLVAQFQH